MKNKAKKTIVACFIGYIVQAIVVNFLPLLFVKLQSQYHIPLSQITVLITVNFLVQLMVDVLCVSFVDRIGYRISALLAHLFSAIGLALLAFLPDLLPSPFVGILICTVIYAIGGGLLEVIISPMVEACPTDHKEKAMSLLHSFYCWGHVGVVAISTLFFFVFGIENWKIMALLWALVPLCNAVFFLRVPIYTLQKEGEKGMSPSQLFRRKIFWLFLVMMLCAGASEQAVSQWASVFAESGLGVSKTIGDLAGPMAFAIFMGAARLLYGKYGERIRIDRFLLYSTIGCIACYLWIALIPIPILSLVGCALCGFTVGIMWPGIFSTASKTLPSGGTAMFAWLAVCGDLGCMAGPTVAGVVSEVSQNNLRIGICAAIVFPVLLLGALLLLQKKSHRNKNIHIFK